MYEEVNYAWSLGSDSQYIIPVLQAHLSVESAQNKY